MHSNSLDGAHELKNAIWYGCSTVDSKLDFDGIGWYYMAFNCIKKKRKRLYLTLLSDNKEQRFRTKGQTESLHGKPLPTASQFWIHQGLRRGGDTHSLVWYAWKIENVDTGRKIPVSRKERTLFWKLPFIHETFCLNVVLSF